MGRVRATAMAVVALAALAPRSARAAYLENVPQTVRQPDGTVLHLLATGDEHLNWLHDANGYLVMRRPDDGRLVYAVEDGGRLAPSGLVVGRADPVREGLTPGLRPDPGPAVAAAAAGNRLRVRAMAAPGVPTFTSLNNIVVFVRFADEEEFSRARPLATYEGLFNSVEAGAVSMRNYFLDASYGQLTIGTSFFPSSNDGYVASFQDAHPRSFYMPFDATTDPDGYNGEGQRQSREMDLLAAALAAVSSQVPADLDVDTNHDGNVDNVCFIVSGQPTAWSTLLWPHQWSLIGESAMINGKRVASFNLQLESMVRVGVLCHEMSHTLGAPDLYHYSQDRFTPIGPWDLMANTANRPQQICAYVKYRYLGWLKELPLISTSGSYTLRPLTALTQNCYKVASPNSAREYFVLEYRRHEDLFDGAVPVDGLVVYRINTGVGGNSAGPPDGVYIYRPGGEPNADGAIRAAALGSHVGRPAIDGVTDPFDFLTWGSLGGLSVTDIGAPGESIAFTVNIQPACQLDGFGLSGPESPVHGGDLDLSWSTSTGATSYDVYFGSEADPPLLASTSGTSMSVGITSGDTRYWKAVATSACGRLTSGQAWRLDADPAIPMVTRGVPVEELALDAGSWTYLAIDVPAGARALVVATSGGSGDADLFLRRGVFPTKNLYDVSSVRSGNQELCVIAKPAAGRWYIGMYAYATFHGVTLSGNWVMPPRRRLLR